MAEQILLVMARRGDHYIAGALNLFGGGVLYGRNWGSSEYVPFLHFETCYYQAIDFAIHRGLDKVEAGAQGTHKLLRGYLPEPTYSAHYIAHPAWCRAVDQYLRQERAAVAAEREELAEHGPSKSMLKRPGRPSQPRHLRSCSMSAPLSPSSPGRGSSALISPHGRHGGEGDSTGG